MSQAGARDNTIACEASVNLAYVLSSQSSTDWATHLRQVFVFTSLSQHTRQRRHYNAELLPATSK